MKARLLGSLLLLAPAIAWTQARIDERFGAYRAQQEVLYLWSGEHVKRLVPGFEDLAASIYWLRTVQYFGGQRLFARNKSFDLLLPLAEITTTLDPRLEIAYRYGAIFLAEASPMGAGRPRDAVALLQKGAKALPNSWRLQQDLGFFYFLYLNDAETASKVLVEAAKIPGAAFWLRTLAADVLAKGGHRELSRQMWAQMHEQAEEGIIRANAEIQLQILDALDQADGLTSAVSEFQGRFGRRPETLAELEASGMARGGIVDKAGVPFDYDVRSGRVTVSPKSPYWRPLPPPREVVR